MGPESRGSANSTVSVASSIQTVLLRLDLQNQNWFKFIFGHTGK